MKNLKPLLSLSLMVVILGLTACDHQKKNETDSSSAEQQAEPSEKAEVLPYLNIKEAKADYALPFCEKKNCIDIDIQTIKTQDKWLDSWIAKNQSMVIQQQIDQNLNLSLQQAINAYVKKSDEWKVYDIIFDGISLMKNYRADFREHVSENGIESLITSLRE